MPNPYAPAPLFPLPPSILDEMFPGALAAPTSPDAASAAPVANKGGASLDDVGAAIGRMGVLHTFDPFTEVRPLLAIARGKRLAARAARDVALSTQASLDETLARFAAAQAAVEHARVVRDAARAAEVAAAQEAETAESVLFDEMAAVTADEVDVEPEDATGEPFPGLLRVRRRVDKGRAAIGPSDPPERVKTSDFVKP